jgi:MFS family permease
MGGSTFLIGLVPGFASIGWAAPIIVLILRLVQGLALGGEYGGAATYVAEHAPKGRRGFYTSWIQTTATLGLFLALGIIILIRNAQGVEQFSSEWGGWRYPFWISLLLVIVSIFIRMKMSESPVFSKLKKEGKTSTNPFKESFGHKANFKMVLLALFGAVMGQGVIWYTGQFYAQNFLETVCKIDFLQSRNIMIIAILFATPFFVVFGGLSDKIGRKWIMMLGMLCGIVAYLPIYTKFLEWTNPAERVSMIDAAATKAGAPTAFYDIKHPERLLVKTIYDTAYTDGSIFKYIKTDTLTLNESFTPRNQVISFAEPSSGIVKNVAMHAKKNEVLSPGITAIALKSISSNPGTVIEKTMGSAIYWKIIFFVFLQILFVTMVYGPIAAFLVELFPTKIRYTSMSLPYHIGNGIFGGLVPFLATLIVEFTKTPENPGGNPLAGLYYPIGVAVVCFIIGSIYLSNKIDEDVND